MITLTAVGPQAYSAKITTRGRYCVYLDTDMLIEIGRGPAPRRDRFVAAIRKRGVLLFSEANLSEAGQLKGATGIRVLDTLKGVGRYWAPLTMNCVEVIEREVKGEFGSQPFSHWFLRGLVETQLDAFDKKGVSLSGLDEDTVTGMICDLSEAVCHTCDTTGDRNDVKAGMDAKLKQILETAFNAYRTDPASFDAQVQQMTLDPASARCTYVFHQLVHTLVSEYKQRPLGRNDAMDLIHAVMAVSFASIVALDRAWKERVTRIRDIGKLAQVFYRPEADQLVNELERLVEIDPNASPAVDKAIT